MKRDVVVMLLCSMAFLLSAPLAAATPIADPQAAAKKDLPLTDPRLGILNLTYTKQGVEFDLVNRGSTPIVFWVALLATAPGRWRSLEEQRADKERTSACIDNIRGSAGRLDLIQPGAPRRVVARTYPNCSVGRAKLYRISAAFADGTWAGTWADLGQVTAMTVRRAVAQTWLVSLQALRSEPDPVATLGNLFRQVDRTMRAAARSFEGYSSVPSVRPSEQMLKKRLESTARMHLHFFVMRAYRHIVIPDSGSVERPDARAEKSLKLRADATRQIKDAIEREIAIVEAELADTAWITLFGPNGERVGPAAPPPPPTLQSLALWNGLFYMDAAPPALRERPRP